MRRAFLAPLLLVAASIATTMPVTPPAAAAEPAPFVVGFEVYPIGLDLGDVFHGATIDGSDTVLRAVTVKAPDGDAFLAEVSGLPNIRYVEPSPEVLGVTTDGGPTFTPNDTAYSAEQYGPQIVSAPAAWDITRGTTTAAVCVIDSGVRRTHEDIGNARWLGWTDFVNGNAVPYDDLGHGTHVAGIAAATMNNAVGVAGMAAVGIYGVKVITANGLVTSPNVAFAIRWCADHSIRRTVINLSLWVPVTTALVDAINYAHDTRDRIIVWSAGNTDSACEAGNDVCPVARAGRVVAVSCTNAADNVCGYSRFGDTVDMAAPGDAIVSTFNANNASYAQLNGTSMSAPHVAGALALSWSYNTAILGDEIRARAQDGARDLGAAGIDVSYGNGRLDAKCALARTPHPPGLVQAAPGTSVGQIKLTWNQAVNCRSALTRYNISRATTPTGSYAVIAQPSGTTTAYTDSGLTVGTSYYYKVSATNAFGSGYYSPAACSQPYPGLATC